ncbi:hypothetical protein [Vibrio quintilis]|uniref:Uncharacterized protein n=1 Tax=Vibrio quintilis TaxID=1117707 RepID=A0A1M7Z101_9VIBR|nr:hypothetical protein [Vibrio quintilis]SHO58514.1 hypothetical protein VQ7734_04286 [Vibrio quintilis]
MAIPNSVKDKNEERELQAIISATTPVAACDVEKEVGAAIIDAYQELAYKGSIEQFHKHISRCKYINMLSGVTEKTVHLFNTPIISIEELEDGSFIVEKCFLITECRRKLMSNLNSYYQRQRNKAARKAAREARCNEVNVRFVLDADAHKALRDFKEKFEFSTLEETMNAACRKLAC